MFKKTALALAMLVPATPVQAIFCTAHEYAHPRTGNRIWLFGDIHCDLDSGGTISRLQQHTLLEEAKQRKAHIIAENVSGTIYNPYKYPALMGLDACLLYALIQKKRHQLAAVPGYFLAVHAFSWYLEWRQSQKPTVDFDSFVNGLKNYPANTQVIFSSCTPLSCLVELAKARGLPATDLEFRYHMLGAIRERMREQMPLASPIFTLLNFDHWLNRMMTRDQVRYPITIRDYCQVNDAIVREVEAYKDEASFQDFYTQCIEQYKSSYITRELREIMHKDPNRSLATVVPSIAKKFGKETATALTDFTEHNKSLFDARVAHEIFKMKVNPLFVCTGAEHTERMRTLVELLGYVEVRAQGSTNQNLKDAGIIGRTSIEIEKLDYLALDLQKFFAGSSS